MEKTNGLSSWIEEHSFMENHTFLQRVKKSIEMKKFKQFQKYSKLLQIQYLTNFMRILVISINYQSMNIQLLQDKGLHFILILILLLKIVLQLCHCIQQHL